MKRSGGVRFLVVAAALLAASAAAAAGAETADEFARRLLGREPVKGATYACFDRMYDPDHLASHPQQNVRSMVVLAIYIVDPKGEDQPRYDLRIGVNFRKTTHVAEVEGDCRALKPENDPNGPVTAHCSVACDGGRIDVALKDNGSILVTIPEGARTSDESPDAPNGPNVKALHGGFGADDKLFRVDRADLGKCLELAADKGEKTAMRRQR
jgi:hypothetical protein